MERNYILVRSVKEGNRLLRRENRKNPGKVTANVSCHHLVEFAKDIVLRSHAAKGSFGGAEVLDQTACAVLLDKIMKENWNEESFLPKHCLGISAAMEVLESLNLLRMGQGTKELPLWYQNNKNGKESQLKWLEQEYVHRLLEQGMYDEALLYQEANQYLEQEEGWLPKGTFYISEDCLELLTAIERKFLHLLTRAKYKVFSLEKLSAELLQNHTTFFKSYGMANEAEYVARKICEEGQLFGEVLVLYTSPEYEPFLRGAFGNHKIAYRLVSNHLAAENRFVSAMAAALRFAENGFLYKDLKQLVQIPGMQMKYTENGKEQSIGLSEEYFQTILAGIAWGRQRYLDYIKQQREEETKQDTELPCEKTEEEKRKAERRTKRKQEFLVFLEMLCMVFEPEETGEYSCIHCFNRLVEFLRKYMNAPLEWREIAGILPKEAKILKQLPLLSSEQELATVLLERVESMKVEEEEKQDAVSVALFGNGTAILDRKYVYVLGLSAQAFGKQQTDSAVLSDAERKLVLDLDAGFVDLREEREQQRTKYFYQTLQTWMGHSEQTGHLYLGYSCFDTVKLQRLAPAVCYFRLLELSGKDEKEIEYMEYQDIIEEDIRIAEETIWIRTAEEEEAQNKTNENILTKTVQENQVADTTNETVTNQNTANKDTTNENEVPVIRFSATSLQTLINCPLQYYYQRMKYLPREEYKERNPEQWLNAAERGTLVHEILEKYCNRYFRNRTSIQIAENVQEEEFLECVESAAKKMQLQCPYDSKASYELELEDISNRCHNYLEYMHKTFSAPDNHWMVMECEKEFKEVILYYNETDRCEPEQATYALQFDGFIDRVDYYVDEQDVYHFRIMDYKSGKRNKQEKGIEELQKVQHIVYALAILEECKKKQKKAVIDEVCFLHLFEKKPEDWFLSVCGEDINELPYRVRQILCEVLLQNKYTVLEKLDCSQPASSAKKTEKLSQTKSACEYCTYKDICREKEYMGVEW